MANKISDLFGALDNKVSKAKLEQALSMLKNKSPEELSKKIGEKDRSEILSKLDEFDKKKLSEMNIDLDKLKTQITPADLEKVKQIAGKDADLVMQKIRELLGGPSK